MCRYSEELLDKLWAKAQEVDNYDPTKYRKDACGAWIMRDKYGDRTSAFGWEVDHVYPESKLKKSGVSMELIDIEANLRPLNWKNNDSKGADYPSYQAKMKSEGNRNVEGEFEFTVNEQVRAEVERLYREYM